MKFLQKRYLFSTLVGLFCLLFISACIDTSEENNGSKTALPTDTLTFNCITTCGGSGSVTPSAATIKDLIGSWKSTRSGTVLTFSGTRGTLGVFDFTDENNVKGQGTFFLSGGELIVSIDANASKNPFLQSGLINYTIESISQKQIVLKVSTNSDVKVKLKLLDFACTTSCGVASRPQAITSSNLTSADLQGAWKLTVPADSARNIPAIDINFTINNDGTFTSVDSTGSNSSGKFSIFSDFLSLNFSSSTNSLVQSGIITYYRIVHADQKKLTLQQVTTAEAVPNLVGAAFNFTCSTNCPNLSEVTVTNATSESFAGVWKTENIPGIPLTFTILSNGLFSFTDDSNNKSGKGAFSILGGITTVNVTSSDSLLLPAGISFYKVTNIGNNSFTITLTTHSQYSTLAWTCSGSCGSSADVAIPTAKIADLAGTWKLSQGNVDYTMTLAASGAVEITPSSGTKASGTLTLSNGVLQLELSQGTYLATNSKSLGMILAAIDSKNLVLLVRN